MSKIHSESNSQLHNYSGTDKYCCARYVKDTFWKQFTTAAFYSRCTAMLCPICQRYILKAIHNISEHANKKKTVVPDMSKIHSESNSQLDNEDIDQNRVVPDMSKIHSESNSQREFHPHFHFLGCARYVKDTFWKQFTTVEWQGFHQQLLCPICQRYILKAIHNALLYKYSIRSVVPDVSLAGAWIETCNVQTFRVRQVVAPRAGAWIETNKCLGLYLGARAVAPRAGAWIETIPTEVSISVIGVAPSAGAWS